MRTLKILISIAAAIILAAGTAMTGGLFNVPAGYVQLLLAAAGAISILGISPYQFDAATTKALSAIALIMTAVQAAHAGAVTPGPQAHPWLWNGFAIVTVIVGMLGKSPIPHGAPVPPVPPPPAPTPGT
jgi:hypothetical protein